MTDPKTDTTTREFDADEERTEEPDTGPEDPTAGRSAGTPENAEADPTRGRSAGTSANPLNDPTRP